MSEPTRHAGLPAEVSGALSADSRIRRVELTGSRERGTATPLSDWDFKVTVVEFAAVRKALPRLVGPLRPVIAQWDRLSPIWCYMLILAGPAKVDLLFDQRHPIEPAWQVSVTTLSGIDDHFWDWALWLGSKQFAGRNDLVTSELRKLHEHLLGPMGVAVVPSSLAAAIVCYRDARDLWERRLQRRVPRAAEAAVLPDLRGLLPDIDQSRD